MNKIVLALSLVLSASTHAQTRGSDLGIDAQRLSSEIQRESRRLTRDEAARIQMKFAEIREILYRPGSGNPMPSGFTCIAKDNDNRAPYVYAVREGINMIRVTNMTFNSVATCEASIRSLRWVGSAAIVCASKDNDDRAPWVFSRLDGMTVTKLANTSTSTFEACTGIMNRMLVSGYSSNVTLCRARDNDGRSPYVASQIDLATGQFQNGSELFNDTESCWRFLGN